MTPSTNTPKQEEWEIEFDKFINEVCEDSGNEQFISVGFGFNDELREFVRSLIHQTQQAERMRFREMLKDEQVEYYNGDGSSIFDRAAERRNALRHELLKKPEEL